MRFVWISSQTGSFLRIVKLVCYSGKIFIGNARLYPTVAHFYEDQPIYEDQPSLMYHHIDLGDIRLKLQGLGGD